jgi:Flp pilus assembly protein TadG
MRLPQQHGQRHPREAGAVLELAMVAPLLVAFILGTLEGARALHVKQVLSDACRGAGRLAVQPNVSFEEVTGCAENILTYNSIPSGTVTVAVNETNVSDFSSAQEGDAIRVTVTVPASSVGYIMPVFLPADSLLSSTIVMRRQQ